MFTSWKSLVCVLPILGTVYIFNSGFSCDVISSKCCKSSYQRLPCWFPFHSLVPESTIKCPRTSHLVQIPNYNFRSGKNISTHTRLKFKILFFEVNSIQNNSVLCCFFLILHCTKRKPRSRAKSCA